MRYFAEMVSAVGYLHEQGVVHRDLKLENVLLSGANTCAAPPSGLAVRQGVRSGARQGAEDATGMGMRGDLSRRARPYLFRCKLCDFGLAHAYDVDPSGAVVRMPLKEVCGSKSYCAPEVLAGLGYDGELADMWSLVRPAPLHAPPHPTLLHTPRPSTPRAAPRTTAERGPRAAPQAHPRLGAPTRRGSRLPLHLSPSYTLGRASASSRCSPASSRWTRPQRRTGGTRAPRPRPRPRQPLIPLPPLPLPPLSSLLPLPLASP